MKLSDIAQIIKRHQTLVIAVLGLVVTVGLVVLSFWPRARSGSSTDISPPAQKGPTTTVIDNYADYVKNLSDKTRTEIESTLYWTISDNLHGQNPPTSGAVIRKNSYKQDFTNVARQIYLTSFIVDLENIKQSYRVNSYYSPLPPEITGLVDYTTLVLCLDTADLVYGEFDCTDRIKMEQGR